MVVDAEAEMQGQTSLDRQGLLHPLRMARSSPVTSTRAMVALRTGEPVRDVVMGVLNPRDDARRWISVTGRVPLFRSGTTKPYEVYTLFNDITDRKEVEQALRETR